MKKYAQKRIDMYDIGNGLTLMNVINKNENGKLHQITTYIGIEGNGFSHASVNHGEGILIGKTSGSSENSC